MRPLGARGVEIHPGHTRFGKPLGQEPLELLRAHAAHLLHRVAAFGTAPSQRLLVTTVVTPEHLGRPMHGQRHRAVGALPHRSAIRALNK